MSCLVHREEKEGRKKKLQTQAKKRGKLILKIKLSGHLKDFRFIFLLFNLDPFKD